MNREWLTLVFGVVLVFAVAVVSVVNNMGWFSRSADEPATEERPTATPSDPAAVRPAPPSVPAPSKAPPEPEPTPRLDAAVPVVHKHRLGSCEGILRAGSTGLSYTTPERDDSFRLPLAEVDEFELDQDRKNLRVRQRGGRTWNFAPRGNDTGGLPAFYRQVERARRQSGR